MSRLNRQSILIIFLAWLAYMLSYLGRADYGSCMIEIVNQTGVARGTAGMVSSAFSLCNAIGQIASGFVLKKISPVKVIGIELFTVAGINLLFPNCHSFLLMAVLWGMNGCMQSTLLCGATQIFVENLEEPYLSRGATLLNTVGAVGGTINYVITWILIKNISWRAVFITVSMLLFLTGVAWNVLMPQMTTQKGGQEEASDTESKKKKSFNMQVFVLQLKQYGTVFAIMGCFFIGFLRESVSLWVPSYVSDVFGVNSSFSTIVTVFVPAFQICGALLGGSIGRRVYNLHFSCSVCFAISGFSMFFLLWSGKRSLPFTVILFVLNAICMTAALTFFLSLFPIRFLGREHAPLYVGIFNFFVHAGDFFSSSGIGWLSQIGGWQFTFEILGGIAFFAAAVCGAVGVVYRRK